VEVVIFSAKRILAILMRNHLSVCAHVCGCANRHA